MESDQIDLEYENIKKFENIDVSLKVHAGAAGITIGNLLKLQVGSVIELDTLAGEHLKIYVNGVPIARGEIVPQLHDVRRSCRRRYRIRRSCRNGRRSEFLS